jgi:hypothetical protein
MLAAVRARQVSTVVRMVDAYNAGRLDQLLPLLEDGVGWTDCDYKVGALVTLTGKAEVTSYLRQRFADRDQLDIGTVFNQNPDPASSDLTAGVEFSRRSSDTLRAMGFTAGIKPTLVAKVIFDFTGSRIATFANGPFGGSIEACRRSN